MNDYTKGFGILLGAATILAVEAPKIAIAQAEEQIQVQQTEQGLTLRLPTKTNNTPKISKTQEGTALMVDLSNVQLELGEDKEFSKNNPIPGIALLTVTQYQSDAVRIMVQGSTANPDAKIQSTKNGELVVKVTAKKETTTERGQNSKKASQQSSGPVLRSDSRMSNSDSNAGNEKDVMFPNPETSVEGQPSPQQQRTQSQPTPQQTRQSQVKPTPQQTRRVQPQAPQATPPPVGDIAVSSIDPSPNPINLGVDTKVPRLVLRDAPVREVLSLLARSANLNLVYATQQQQGEGEGSTQQTISVDLEDEPVQRAFNAVLQMSGLEANRKGNTIFVGKKLPQQARNLVTRTLRLNEVTAAQASSFLATQGAATQQIFQDSEQIVGPNGNVITEDPEPPEIITVDVAEDDKGNNPLLLDGLSVSTDERLNSVTLVGKPKQVEIATQFLKQLDARRRQVAVNVQIIDVNLLETEEFSNSFSFGIGDSFFVNDRGAAALGFGGTVPPARSQLRARPGQQLPPVTEAPIPEGAEAAPFFDSRPNARFGDPGFSGPSIDTGRIDQGTVTTTEEFNQLTTEEQTDVLQRVLDNAENIDPNQVRDELGFEGEDEGPLLDLLDGNRTIDQLTQTERTQVFESVNRGLSSLLPQSVRPNFGVPGNPFQPGISDLSGGQTTFEAPGLFQFPSRFLGLLEAEVTSGNAQILTDPTLVVKEGQTASVNLTQEVFGGVERTVTETGEVEIEPIIKDAGLTLTVNVNRIDDNGFVTLNVNPTVSAPSTTRETGTNQGEITLLQERNLTSGEIRLRDGKTLILAGIIQDQDRTTVSKVPILGDIPVLGALFRSTERERERREVIVLITPKILDPSARGTAQSVNRQNFSPETQKMLEQQRGNPQRRLPQQQQPQSAPQPQQQMPAPQQQRQPAPQSQQELLNPQQQQR